MFLLSTHSPHQWFLHYQVSCPVDKAFSVQTCMRAPCHASEAHCQSPPIRQSGTFVPTLQALRHRRTIQKCRGCLSHPIQCPSFISKQQFTIVSLRASSETLSSLPQIPVSLCRTTGLNLRQTLQFPFPRSKGFYPKPNSNLISAHWAGLRGRQALSYHRKWNQTENAVFIETPSMKNVTCGWEEYVKKSLGDGKIPQGCVKVVVKCLVRRGGGGRLVSLWVWLVGGGEQVWG